MAAKSSAMPLVLLFSGLVVYASLYPFEGWRWPGFALTAFLQAPWPRYWTWFDLVSNLLGYMPLGFLLTLGLSRSGWGRWSWPLGVVLPAALSLTVETLQNFLPMRVPSNLDLGLNTAGAFLGATAAWALERLGGLRRWAQFRADWFSAGAHESLVLLALWPFALLYPVSVPFGLGQVWWRLEAELARLLADSPFLRWVPSSADAAIRLSPLAQAMCIALGLLVPVLLAYVDVSRRWRRVLVMVMVVLVGGAAAGLSAAMTYGPEHVWAWVDAATALGVLLAIALGLLLVGLPSRVCQVLLLLVLAVLLSVLNQVPESAYFNEALEVWEQGRFIRFHGLSQWLGWLWPYAVLAYAAGALVRAPAAREADH